MDNLLLWIIGLIVLFICFIYSHSLTLAFIVLSVIVILTVYYVESKKVKECEERCGKQVPTQVPTQVSTQVPIEIPTK